ncbi:hypothetical protein PN499_03585 [Kamptonema animale CS-326]|uniref:hypothetical protein n=1 Tax=Kamptonema animale TaxID=92934 RepID=UPI00232D601E|nr:hypothetical protein [Kamptonema animale]MDB9510285.1 hypothetical protein [Kamptonema animale CS-326]
MHLFKVILVLFVLLVNLAFTPPSWADPKTPKYSNNPDYIEVTQALNTLLAAKETPIETESYTREELDKKIADLEFQKYALETGINWGQCRNETSSNLAIYGPKGEKSRSSYDNALYFLGPGQTTQPYWDCEGVYIPSGAATNLTTAAQGEDLKGAVALKIVDGSQLVVKTNPDTSALDFNVPSAKFFKSGDVNWFIPNVSQTSIDTRIPNVPMEDPND